MISWQVWDIERRPERERRKESPVIPTFSDYPKKSEFRRTSETVGIPTKVGKVASLDVATTNICKLDSKYCHTIVRFRLIK